MVGLLLHEVYAQMNDTAHSHRGPCKNYALLHLPESNQQEQGEKQEDYGDATTNVADYFKCKNLCCS